MKLFLALALMALSLFAIPASAEVKQAAPDLAKATLLVYQGKQVCKYHKEQFFIFEEDAWGCEFKTKFTCTATVVAANGQGGYIGLTAGHCFNWTAIDKGEYYIADTLVEKPVLHKMHIQKFENDNRYDYAVFDFSSLEDYAVISIANDVNPKAGDEVTNVNYALGLAKQVTNGNVISGIVDFPAIPSLGDIKGRFLVNIGVGPGASGSAVVDKKTGQIIGLVEAVFPGTQMPTIVMPTGKTLKNFMQDDSAGIRPRPAGPLPKVVTPEPETLWQHFRRSLREWWDR